MPATQAFLQQSKGIKSHLEIADSGCSWTVSNQGIAPNAWSSGFISISKDVGDTKVQVADSHELPVTGVGSYRLMLSDGSHFVLSDCLYVPEMEYTLIAVSQLASKDRGILFGDKIFLLLDFLQEQHMFLGKVLKGIFFSTLKLAVKLHIIHIM